MENPLPEFLVVNASGERLAGPVYAEEATLIMRLLPAAEAVVRQHDGALIAHKKRYTPSRPYGAN